MVYTHVGFNPNDITPLFLRGFHSTPIVGSRGEERCAKRTTYPISARARPWQTLLESSLALREGTRGLLSLSGKWQPDQQSGTLDNVSRKGGRSDGRRAFSVGSPTLRHSALLLFLLQKMIGLEMRKWSRLAKNYIH